MKPAFSTSQKHLGFGEFIVLMASMMSIVALAIDAVLPALPIIGADLHVQDINDTQLIISLLFLGLAIGQIFYGPLSDTFGRKKAIYAGYLIFTLGSLLSFYSQNFESMCMGRFMQGLGVAAPRVICTAIIRDRYAGNTMARVQSLTMMIFILVPMVAPAFGQLMLSLYNWQAIFTAVFICALLVHIWFAFRLPDTLTPDKRIPLSFQHIRHAVQEIISSPIALGNTLVAGVISGAFLAYLSTVQQIFQVQYGLGKLFPAIFASLAFFVGIAGYINARLVIRFGMRKLSWIALLALLASALPFALYCVLLEGHPPFAVLMAYFALTLFTIGSLFGNLNAMAMEPLGKIAGVGASVVGSLTTFISVPFGITIGQFYQGSVTPLVTGFAACAVISIAITIWIQKAR